MPLLSSEITVVNLAESPVELTVAIRDPGSESDSEYVVGTFSIAPLQVTSQAIVPARIRLEFKQGGGEIGSCTIDLEEGEQVQFAAIESGIAITTAGEEPEDPAELSVATASRCQAGEGT